MKLKFGSQLIETHFESEWIHSVYLGNVKAGILVEKGYSGKSIDSTRVVKMRKYRF